MNAYVRAAIATLLVLLAIVVGVTAAHFLITLFPKVFLGVIFLAGVAVVYWTSLREEQSKDRHAEIMKKYTTEA